MRPRPLGVDGPVVGEIGLGTWQNFSAADQPAADRLVRAALEAGVTLFDTAGSYGDAQVALGRALRGVPRADYVLSTKVFFPDQGAGGGLRAAAVRSGAEAALRDLRTDRIDLLTAHRFDPLTPLAETVAAFGALIRAGKVAHWGVSEWTAEQIRQAADLADTAGVPRPVSNQPQYSVLWRVPEAEVIPACRSLGIGQVAFWSLAQGILSGKYRPGAGRPAGSRASGPTGAATMGYLLIEEVLDRVALFERLARRRGLTAAQLALAWVLARPGVSAVLVGATSPQQLQENAAAGDRELSPATITLIDQIFAGCVQTDPAATG